MLSESDFTGKFFCYAINIKNKSLNKREQNKDFGKKILKFVMSIIIAIIVK